jgi:copper chaperone
VATMILTVPDISCGHCQRTITQALAPLAGVRSVRVDIPTRQVSVEYDAAQVDVERFKAVLAEEDYPVADATAEQQPGAEPGVSDAVARCACCSPRRSR